MKQAIFTITLLCSRTLTADCPEGVYTTTEADKQFLTETVAVVRTALPPTPDGWRLEDRNPKVYVPPRSYCKGAENQPLIEGYSVKYVWVAGQKDLTQKLTEIQKKINAVNGVPMAAEQLKQMTELQIKDRDLRYAARKAEKPEADRMKAEAAVFSKQAEAMRTVFLNAKKPQLDALEAERSALQASTPTEVDLFVLVNGTGLDTSETNPVPALSGATLTRANATRTVLAYGGPWAQDSGGGLKANYPRGANMRKVYGVTIQAKGDPKQAAALLSKLDGAALKGLVSK